MLVRVLAATVDSAGGALFRGDEHELADEEAARLIAAGKAEAVQAKDVPAPPADKMVRRRKTK